MVLQKTCWLGAIHPLRVGCLIGARGRLPLDPLIRLGFFFGAAFQIQDDLLNLEAGPAYGKEINGDLLEGKRTLMIIHTLRHGERRERRELTAFPRAAARRAIGRRGVAASARCWSARGRSGARPHRGPWVSRRRGALRVRSVLRRRAGQPRPRLHAQPADLGAAALALTVAAGGAAMSRTILLYGATGFSGRLIAAEVASTAAWRIVRLTKAPEIRMILAGRDGDALGEAGRTSAWTTASSVSTTAKTCGAR